MPNDELVLIMDIGSSSCRSALFREDGFIVDSAVNSYSSYYPQPGWVEQDPADWWAAVVSSVKEILERSHVEGSRIAVIGITGQMHGILPLGEDGRTLSRCLTLHDQRALREADRISTEMGLSGVYDLTGARIDGSAPLAKIAWFSTQAPDVHKKTAFYLPCKDYIKYVLTGEVSTDPIEAAGTLLFDIHKGDWSQELLRICGASRHQMPPVRSPWQVAGSLTQEAARQLGLISGTPVVVGAGDDIECLGMGLIKPGTSLEHFGTTGSIMTCVDQAVGDPEMAVELYPHPDPSLWLLGGSVNNAGRALVWASRTLYGEGDKLVSEVLTEEQLQKLQEAPLLFLPQLNGERCPIWNPDAKGAWLGLGIEHGPDDLFRAVAEGVVFSLKHVMDRIEELSIPITSVAVSNSAAGNLPWLELRANIYEKPLNLLASTEPAALGTMIVASVGIGLFGSLQEGVEQTVFIQDQILPDEDLVAAYSGLYELYREAVKRYSVLFDLMTPLKRDTTRGRPCQEA